VFWSLEVGGGGDADAEGDPSTAIAAIRENLADGSSSSGLYDTKQLK